MGFLSSLVVGSDILFIYQVNDNILIRIYGFHGAEIIGNLTQTLVLCSIFV
jgi:hypothetical protein